MLRKRDIGTLISEDALTAPLIVIVNYGGPTLVRLTNDFINLVSTRFSV